MSAAPMAPAMLPANASIAIWRWNRCGDLAIRRADAVHHLDREAVRVERAARGQHDRGGRCAAQQQNQADATHCRTRSERSSGPSFR